VPAQEERKNHGGSRYEFAHLTSLLGEVNVRDWLTVNYPSGIGVCKKKLADRLSFALIDLCGFGYARCRDCSPE
jgi:hypothetical protein